MHWFSFHLADFAFSFLSILFEGVPFLLLGAVISGTVEVFLPPQALTRLLPKNPVAAVFLSGLLGGIFPMCECGAVVVIRRFLAKGLPVSCAVTYMLAAPIVSPLVAISTFAAFRAQSPWVMMPLRLSLGYLIAVAAGLLVQRLPLASVLQTKVIESMPGRKENDSRGNKASTTSPMNPEIGGEPGTDVALTSAAHSRSGLRIAVDTGGDGAINSEWIGQSAWSSVWTKLLRVIHSATADFLDVALFFVIGAAIAATFNTAVDQTVIQPLAGNSPLAILTLMGLAGAMALCSSTDAFIAASFITFPFTAKLAFLVFGPVFDVKLFFLYGLVYRRKFIVSLAIGLFVTIALICMRLSGFGL